MLHPRISGDGHVTERVLFNDVKRGNCHIPSREIIDLQTVWAWIRGTIDVWGTIDFEKDGSFRGFKGNHGLFTLLGCGVLIVMGDDPENALIFGVFSEPYFGDTMRGSPDFVTRLSSVPWFRMGHAYTQDDDEQGQEVCCEEPHVFFSLNALEALKALRF
jgi:hypothetical protein